MSRPLSTVRSDLASAIVHLREALGETEVEFARRLHTTPTSIARYETTRAPRGAMLKRLYRLAEKHHPPSAQTFLVAMEYERELQGRQRRMRAIADARNLDQAAAELEAAWIDYQHFMQYVRPQFDRQLVWVGKAENLGERLLRLADLIVPGRRKEIE